MQNIYPRLIDKGKYYAGFLERIFVVGLLLFYQGTSSTIHPHPPSRILQNSRIAQFPS